MILTSILSSSSLLFTAPYWQSHLSSHEILRVKTTPEIIIDRFFDFLWKHHPFVLPKMRHPMVFTGVLPILTIFTLPSQGLPPSTRDESGPAPMTLKPRVTDDVITYPYMCRINDLPEGNYPAGISKADFTDRRDLCFLNRREGVGNVGCFCGNFKRVYCPPLFGNPALNAAFGELCEGSCVCFYNNLGAGNDDDFFHVEDDDFDREDDSTDTDFASRRSGLSRLISGVSMASIKSYETEPDSESPSTPANQCQGSCLSMKECGDDCQCGGPISKYVDINPVSPQWTCGPSLAQQALVAIAAGTVLKHTQPKTHHRPGYAGLGGRDVEEGEGEGDLTAEEQGDDDLQWACPCNGTFAHGSCCGTREGEVWDVPNLLKLEI